MGRLDLNYNSIPLYLLLLTLNITLINVTISTSSTRLMSNPLQDGACAMIDCGQGKCKASTTSLLSFECECNPGWSKIQIGRLFFSPCVIPNCTVDFQCKSGSPPPAPLLFPPPNLTDPCALIWCGDGTCVANGTGHSCKCFEGSANLLNSTRLACFNPCYLGADCNNSTIGLGPPTTATATTTPPPPPETSNSDLRRNGSGEMLNCSRILRAAVITIITLLAYLCL